MSFMNYIKKGSKILATDQATNKVEMLTCLVSSEGLDGVWRFESDNVKQGTYILLDGLGKRYGAYNYTFYSNSRKAIDVYRIEQIIDQNKGCLSKLDHSVIINLLGLLK